MLGKESLVRAYRNEFDEEQYQSNGIDLRIKEVREVEKNQLVGITDDGVRYLPISNKIDYSNEESKLYILEKGKQYYIRLDNISMFDDVGGLLQIRSTFNRCGLICTTSVVDKGFKGDLWVMCYSPVNDIIICDNERLLQMVLFKCDDSNSDNSYNGYYQES